MPSFCIGRFRTTFIYFISLHYIFAQFSNWFFILSYFQFGETDAQISSPKVVGVLSKNYSKVPTNFPLVIKKQMLTNVAVIIQCLPITFTQYAIFKLINFSTLNYQEQQNQIFHSSITKLIKMILSMTLPFFFLTVMSYHMREYQIKNSQQSSHNDSSISPHLVFGFMILILSIISLCLNQKTFARCSKVLRKIQANLVEIDPLNQEQIQSANSKLAYVVGNTETENVWQEELLKQKIENCLKIKRVVQVKEFRINEKLYDDEQILSQKIIWVYQHQQYLNGRNNPQNWIIQSSTKRSSQVSFGKYCLNLNQIDSLPYNSTLRFTPKMLENLNRNIHNQTHGNPLIVEDYIYFPKSNNDIESQGSLRMKIMFCQAGKITVLAKSVGHQFEDYFFAIKSPSIRLSFMDHSDQEYFGQYKGINLIGHGEVDYKKLVCEKNDEKWKLLFFLLTSLVILYFGIYLITIWAIEINLCMACSEIGELLASLLLQFELFLFCSSMVWIIFDPESGVKIGFVFLVYSILLYNVFLKERNIW